MSPAEVLARGERLVRLRNAGVSDPIRFVGSNRAATKAIRLSRRAPLLEVVDAPPQPDGCGWCGVLIRKTQTVCVDCEDLEETLLRYREGEL